MTYDDWLTTEPPMYAEEDRYADEEDQGEGSENGPGGRRAADVDGQGGSQ